MKVKYKSRSITDNNFPLVPMLLGWMVTIRVSNPNGNVQPLVGCEAFLDLKALIWSLFLYLYL